MGLAQFAEAAELKSLNAAPRCPMIVEETFFQAERCTEGILQRFCIVSGDRQATTSLRPVQGECPHDNLPFRAKRPVEALHIGPAML